MANTQNNNDKDVTLFFFIQFHGRRKKYNNSTQSKDFNVDVRMDEAGNKRIKDLKHLKTMKSHYSLCSFVIAFDFYCEFRNVNARRSISFELMSARERAPERPCAHFTHTRTKSKMINLKLQIFIFFVRSAFNVNVKDDEFID